MLFVCLRWGIVSTSALWVVCGWQLLLSWRRRTWRWISSSPCRTLAPTAPSNSKWLSGLVYLYDIKIYCLIFVYIWILVSVCFIHISMFLCKQVLCLEKEVTSSQPSSVRVRHSSQNNSCMTTQPQTATSTSNPTVIQPSQNPSCTFAPDTPQGKRGSDGSLVWLAEAGCSASSLEISSSHKHQSHRDSTPSLTSDISLPSATLELQQRLQQLQKWVYIHCFTMCGSRLGFAFFLSVQLNFVRSHTGDFVCVCVRNPKSQDSQKWDTSSTQCSVNGPVNNTAWLTG